MTDRPLEEQVLYRVDGGVAWIVLNRPEAGNSITPDQRNHVIDLLEQISADLSIRAVVLTAAGSRHFCTGADLRVARQEAPKPAGAPERPTGSVARLIAGGAQRLVAAIMDCEKPVVAAVNGTAAGIGAHICFASDLVIASESARFIEAFVRRGIVPDGGGIYLLPRLTGLQKAKELMFFGDDLSAPEAERLGLVNLVVPADKVEQTAREWAERLATGPTVAISQAKRLLNRSLDSDRATAFAEEANAQEITSTSVDGQEGMAAFRERRTPEYKGW
jgi:2-(1,2-epoxy-1,2-dihydrophenyl)acetyl-CoA isomerase